MYAQTIRTYIPVLNIYKKKLEWISILFMNNRIMSNQSFCTNHLHVRNCPGSDITSLPFGRSSSYASRLQCGKPKIQGIPKTLIPSQGVVVQSIKAGVNFCILKKTTCYVEFHKYPIINLSSIISNFYGQLFPKSLAFKV